MYLRWRTRTRKTKSHQHAEENVVLSGYLLESRRINGTPHQITLFSVGSIEKHRLGDTMSHNFFWRELEKRLTESDLKDSAKQFIRDQVAIKIFLPMQVPA